MYSATERSLSERKVLVGHGIDKFYVLHSTVVLHCNVSSPLHEQILRYHLSICITDHTRHVRTGEEYFPSLKIKHSKSCVTC